MDCLTVLLRCFTLFNCHSLVKAKSEVALARVSVSLKSISQAFVGMKKTTLVILFPLHNICLLILGLVLRSDIHN